MTSEWPGYIGATLTTISFVPQAVQIIRSKDAHSISLPMYVVFTIGVAFWLAYGAALGSWSMILANAITLALAAVIVALKLRYG